MAHSDTDWLYVAGKIALGVGVGALATAGAVAVAKSGLVQNSFKCGMIFMPFAKAERHVSRISTV